jgi:hypothetical protein
MAATSLVPNFLTNMRIASRSFFCVPARFFAVRSVLAYFALARALLTAALHRAFSFRMGLATNVFGQSDTRCASQLQRQPDSRQLCVSTSISTQQSKALRLFSSVVLLRAFSLFSRCGSSKRISIIGVKQSK